MKPITSTDLAPLLVIMARSSNYVPDNLREGLALYLRAGVMPGDFLTSVLENDLRRAISFGDPASVANLPNIVKFLYNECPMVSWGSVDTVRAWVSQPPEALDAIAKVRGWLPKGDES